MSMREILYHGKRKDNGEWVEGYYCTNPEWDRKTCGEHHWIISRKNGMRYEVDPSTVGQYTGLTDKNGGKKIFEGDIVKRYDSARAYQVKWNPTFPAFWCFRSSDYKFLLTEDFEVIGSIHDNPELLEVDHA